MSDYLPEETTRKRINGTSKAAAVIPRYQVPEEIVREILLLLPAKSLCRFSTVCKSWSSMIKHSSFTITHLNRRAQYNNRNGIVQFLLNERTTGSCTSYVTKHDPAVLTGDDHECFTKFTCPSQHVDADLIGTCNGLVCLADDESVTTTPSKFPTIIWNPSIRKIVILPTPTINPCKTTYVQTHAFGYDAQSNDYKVLRILQSDGVTLETRKLCEVEVYSLAGNSWKRLSDDTFPAYLKSIIWVTRKYVFVNNALHWHQYRDSELEKHIVVSFDMERELFSEIEMPEALSDDDNRPTFVARYGESLALIDVDNDFDIWIMKEYGVVQSWTKIARIPIQRVCYLSFFDCKSSGELVFGTTCRLDIDSVTTCRRQLQRVNYKTNQVENCRIDGEKYKGIDSFVDSIVLLDQINAIPY